MSDATPCEVPPCVSRGIEEIRESGLTHMLDLPRVIAMCHWLGHHEAAEWIDAQPQAYADLALRCPRCRRP